MNIFVVRSDYIEEDRVEYFNSKMKALDFAKEIVESCSFVLIYDTYFENSKGLLMIKDIVEVIK